MTEKEYIENRVEDQISWYDAKSIVNRKKHYFIKVCEILLAVSIPFLSNFDTIGGVEMKFILGGIGVTIAALAGLSSLYRFHDHWIAYRTTAEALKNELMLYDTKSGIYRKGTFEDFVERFESHVSKENSNWASLAKKSNKKSSSA